MKKTFPVRKMKSYFGRGEVPIPLQRFQSIKFMKNSKSIDHLMSLSKKNLGFEEIEETPFTSNYHEQ